MVDPGHMNLYDRMDPPLRPGDYRLDVSTAVALSTKGASPLPGESRYLRVEGPRFSLLPQEVAGVFPPRNAVGIFEDALPQVVLGRRTLAWEREADEAGVAYDIAHSTKLALIDGNGGIRGFYGIDGEHGTDEIFERAQHLLAEMERDR